MKLLHDCNLPLRYIFLIDFFTIPCLPPFFVLMCQTLMDGLLLMFFLLEVGMQYRF